MAATIHNFLNVDDDWQNTLNWSSGKIPGSGGPGVDTAIIDGPASGASQTLLQNLDRGTVATATLTLGANAANGNTVVIRDRTYVFESAFTDTANYIHIGATASDTIDRLIAAINNSAGEGSTYGTGTVVHAEVTAAAGAGDTMDITAKTAAFNGMYVTLSDTLADGSWDDTTMSKDGGSSLAKFEVRRGYDADIGTDGAKLNLNATDFDIRARAGTVFHAVTTSTTLNLDSDNRVDALVGVGGYTNVEAVSGGAHIGASGCTNLRTSYRTNPARDVYIRLTDKTTVIANTWANGGVIEANCELTNVHCGGHALILYGVADNDFAAPALLLLMGGRFVDNLDAEGGGGAMTLAILMGGVLDGSQTDGVKEIVSLIRFPGHKVLETATGYFDIVSDLTVGE